MPIVWRQINASDTTYCQRFVAVMQMMDARYLAFQVEQLQQWLAGTTGPYVGDVVAAFAAFQNQVDIGFPGRMQTVVLSRYHPGETSADLLMLGWAPPSTDCQPEMLDPVIDDILQQGANWLSTLSAASPVKTVRAIRPSTMGSQQVQRLHDRIYARAAAYAPLVPGNYLQLVRERQLGDAVFWELQIVT